MSDPSTKELYDQLCVDHAITVGKLALLAEALRLHMEWIGPPPTDHSSFDSLREDAWKQGTVALKDMDDG